MTSEVLLLAVAFFCLAAFYSTVGHAGASGCRATMALLGVTPATMRPAALALNVIVATLTSCRFWRAGWTRWSQLLPLAIASVPLVYFGGRLHVPVPGYRAMVGVVLLCSAVVLIWRSRGGESALAELTVQIPLRAAVGSGAASGLLSGLTGHRGRHLSQPAAAVCRLGRPAGRGLILALAVVLLVAGGTLLLPAH